MSDRRRIVITGAGWVTPMGHDLESVWQRLLAGETDVAAIDRFDASTFPTRFASQVRGYDWTDFVEHASTHGRPGMHTQFALGAARQAAQERVAIRAVRMRRGGREVDGVVAVGEGESVGGVGGGFTSAHDNDGAVADVFSLLHRADGGDVEVNLANLLVGKAGVCLGKRNQVLVLPDSESIVAV